MSRPKVGIIYLIHFDQAISDHARHYLGWATDLEGRLDAHRRGQGARLMEVCKERGIGWRVARTWEGTRDRERAIKNRAEGPRLCPECTDHPRPVARGRSAGPKPVPAPAPVPAAGWLWHGNPDLEGISDGYARYQDLAGALTAKWRAELAAGIRHPSPRDPEPGLELELEAL